MLGKIQLANPYQARPLAVVLVVVFLVLRPAPGHLLPCPGHLLQQAAWTPVLPGSWRWLGLSSPQRCTSGSCIEDDGMTGVAASASVSAALPGH
jgi:hypothetical protein